MKQFKKKTCKALIMKKNENNKIHIAFYVHIHSDNEVEESEMKNRFYPRAYDECTYFDDITYDERTRKYNIKGFSYATQLGKLARNIQEQGNVIIIESALFMEK